MRRTAVVAMLAVGRQLCQTLYAQGGSHHDEFSLECE